MINTKNFIEILYQIGFREMEEHEIVFSSFEEKINYRNSKKRFFQDKNTKGEIIIDYITREVNYTYNSWEDERKSYLKILSLDDMKAIFKILNNEYSKELRVLKIKNIFGDGE